MLCFSIKISYFVVMHITITPPEIPIFYNDFVSFKLGEYTGFAHPQIIEYLKSNFSAVIIKDPPKESILKRKPNLIYTVTFPKKPLFPFSQIAVKICNPRNVFKHFLSPLQESKAKRSFYAARHLIANNLDTPFPIAFLESRNKRFITESYYIAEFIDDYIKIIDYLREYPDNYREIREMINAVSEYVRRMHGSDMVHRDLNLANFLLSGRGKKRRLVLVDLNRYRIRKRISSFRRVFDIGRMYWGKYRPEFFQAYSGEDKKIKKWERFFNFYYGWRKRRRRFKNWLKK